MSQDQLVMGQDAVAGDVEKIATPAFHTIAAQITVLVVPDVFEGEVGADSDFQPQADENTLKNVFGVVTAPDGKAYNGFNPFAAVEPKGIGYAAFDYAVRAASNLNKSTRDGLILATRNDVSTEIEQAISGTVESLSLKLSPVSLSTGEQTELVKVLHRAVLATERDDAGKFAHVANICIVVRSPMAGLYNNSANIKNLVRLLSSLKSTGEQHGVDVEFGLIVNTADLLNAGLMNALAADFDFGNISIGKRPLLYAFNGDALANLNMMPPASELLTIADNSYDLLLMNIDGIPAEDISDLNEPLIDDLSDLDEPATVAKAVASQTVGGDDLLDEDGLEDELADLPQDELDDGLDEDLEDSLADDEDGEDGEDEEDEGEDVGYDADVINELAEEITGTDSRNERRAIARKFLEANEAETFGPLVVFLRDIAAAQNKTELDEGYENLIGAINALAADEAEASDDDVADDELDDEELADDEGAGEDYEPKSEALFNLGISMAEASIYESLLTSAREGGDKDEIRQATSDLRGVLETAETLLRDNAKELHAMSDLFSDEQRKLIAGLHRGTIDKDAAQTEVRKLLRSEELLENEDVKASYSHVMSSMEDDEEA